MLSSINDVPSGNGGKGAPHISHIDIAPTPCGDGGKGAPWCNGIKGTPCFNGVDGAPCFDSIDGIDGAPPTRSDLVRALLS